MADQGRVEESGPTEERERLIARLFASTFLESLQSGEDFAIATDHIENRRPRDAEQAVYRGTRRADGKLEKVREYAVQALRAALHRDSARPLPDAFSACCASDRLRRRGCGGRVRGAQAGCAGRRRRNGNGRPTLRLNSR
jgi:hypothetical protein